MELKVTTEVFERGPAHFNMCGQFLHYPLRELDETISAGLAQRLARYAAKRLDDSGFVVNGWGVTVGTMDGDEPPAERGYYVDFANAKGGTISVVGILTRGGWPCLDHGFDIAQANPPAAGQ
jgi:hypothetical protein